MNFSTYCTDCTYIHTYIQARAAAPAAEADAKVRGKVERIFSGIVVSSLLLHIST